MITKDIEVKQVGPDKWELLKPVEYKSAFAWVTAPAGFITDFASTPQFVWTLGMPKSGVYDPIAIVHDYLYVMGGHVETGYYSKEIADKIFQDGLRELGVGNPKRWLMYQAVKHFGKGNY